MAYQRLTAVGLKVGEILALHLQCDTDPWLFTGPAHKQSPVDGELWWTEHRISLVDSVVVATNAERDFTVVAHSSERQRERLDATA